MVVKFKIVAALVSTVALLGTQSTAGARPAHHMSRHHGHITRHSEFRAHGRTHRYGGFRHHHAERRAHRGGGVSGLASWYGPGFQGRKTASGERFNTNGLTAAHRSFPLGCHVLVTNRANGRSVVVRINDRGPFGTGKVIDLSHASARAIGMSGSAPVSLSRL